MFPKSKDYQSLPVAKIDTSTPGYLCYKRAYLDFISALMNHFHLELQHEFKTTAGFQNGIYSFKKKINLIFQCVCSVLDHR